MGNKSKHGRICPMGDVCHWELLSKIPAKDGIYPLTWVCKKCGNTQTKEAEIS